MQFYICKIKHIKYTYEERTFPCPGQTQNISPWATGPRELTTWNKGNFIVTNAILYLKN